MDDRFRLLERRIAVGDALPEEVDRYDDLAVASGLWTPGVVGRRIARLAAVLPEGVMDQVVETARLLARVGSAETHWCGESGIREPVRAVSVASAAGEPLPSVEAPPESGAGIVVDRVVASLDHGGLVQLEMVGFGGAAIRGHVTVIAHWRIANPGPGPATFDASNLEVLVPPDHVVRLHASSPGSVALMTHRHVDPILVEVALEPDQAIVRIGRGATLPLPAGPRGRPVSWHYGVCAWIDADRPDRIRVPRPALEAWARGAP